MNRRDAIKRTALLTGYALSASAVSAVLQGCQADPQQLALEEWTPQFFTKEEGHAVAYIGERILPKTDTPGAMDVNVHEFIDQIAGRCMEQEEQDRFKAGLTQLLADCEKEKGQPFLKCSAEDQLSFLNTQDQAAKALVESEAQLEEDERPFFLDLKQLVLLGYFTSEKVGTEVTAYLPIPGVNEACMPYEAGTPAWTF